MRSEIDIAVPGFKRNELIQGIAKAGIENEAFSSFFRYAKIKGNTLFFVFSHPSAKMEFGYAKERILQRMRLFYKHNKTELTNEGASFAQIHCAVVFPQKKTHKRRAGAQHYSERAAGEFRNTLPGKLGEIMENIRVLVKTQNKEESK